MTTAEIGIALIGPASGVVWWLVGFATEKRTRRIVAEEYTGIIDSKLDMKLAAFKDQLNSPSGYRRSQACELIMRPVVDRVEKVEDAVEKASETVQELHDYAHDGQHKLANDMVGLRAQIEALKQGAR